MGMRMPVTRKEWTPTPSVQVGEKDKTARPKAPRGRRNRLQRDILTTY